MFFSVSKNEVLPLKKYLNYKDEDIFYTVTRSIRSNRASLKFDKKLGFCLQLGDRVTIAQGEEFLFSKLDWVYKNWKKFKININDENTLSYLGKKYELEFNTNELGRAKVIPEDNVIKIYCKDEAVGRKALEKWYRQHAKAVIEGALLYYKDLMRVEYEDVVIRDQKSRWGSCSSKGNLNFNFRLIMAPKSVLDYVVVHELAHLKEMNHSEKFWRIVEEFCPDWKISRKWLKDNGWGLSI